MLRQAQHDMGLQIHDSRMHPLYIVANIKYDAGENVDDKRETDGQERGVDEKQSNFVDGNVKAPAEVGAYSERMAFKKG